MMWNGSAARSWTMMRNGSFCDFHLARFFVFLVVPRHLMATSWFDMMATSWSHFNHSSLRHQGLSQSIALCGGHFFWRPVECRPFFLHGESAPQTEAGARRISPADGGRWSAGHFFVWRPAGGVQAAGVQAIFLHGGIRASHGLRP